MVNRFTENECYASFIIVYLIKKTFYSPSIVYLAKITMFIDGGTTTNYIV